MRPQEQTSLPREALAILKTLDAPVGPLETMIDESVAGRYS
jgi:hypothetical protein